MAAFPELRFYKIRSRRDRDWNEGELVDCVLICREEFKRLEHIETSINKTEKMVLHECLQTTWLYQFGHVFYESTTSLSKSNGLTLEFKGCRCKLYQAISWAL